MFQKEKAQALLTLLQWEHAEQTTGIDDDTEDHCNDWISALTDDELAKICVDVFRNGI